MSAPCRHEQGNSAGRLSTWEPGPLSMLGKRQRSRGQSTVAPLSDHRSPLGGFCSVCFSQRSPRKNMRRFRSALFVHTITA
jgi:hypothetical protein